MLVKLDHFPRDRDENKTIFELPPPIGMYAQHLDVEKSLAPKIQRFLHPWKINGWNMKMMEVWKIMFLAKWGICRLPF